MELAQCKSLLGPADGSWARNDDEEKTKQVDPKKAPGYDLITGKILKKLPAIAITHIIHTILWFQKLE